MLFCLANHSFIRIYDQYGLIVNRLNGQERIYDAIGALFLRHVKRQPQNLQAAAEIVSAEFLDGDVHKIRDDFCEFVMDLQDYGFIVTGSSQEEISENMPSFRYSDLPEINTLSDLQSFNAETDDSVSHFLNEKFRATPKIMALHMDITSRCNEKCRHCYFPAGRDIRDMDTSLALDVLKQAADEGVLNLTISGGECLLHKNFIEILSYARECDFSITILSNITCLTEKIISAIKEANIDYLQTSVYSMDSSEHDWITQVNGSHRATISGIERLIAENIPVRINFPVLKRTYKSYSKVLEWASHRKIKVSTELMIIARMDHSTENLECRLSPEEIRDFLQQTGDETFGFDSENASAKIDDEAPVCSVGRRTICVAQNGDFYPCAGFQNYVLGNAYTQSLRDVWRNSPELETLRGIKWKNFEKCAACEAQKFCSVCVLCNFNASGELFSVDRHFCYMAFQYKSMAQ